MDTFYVIETGGKQYKVAPGQKLNVEKLGSSAGESVVFENVLLAVRGDNVEIGTPYIAGTTVKASVVREGRDKKKIVFRYHSKTRYRKKNGHRQLFTEVEIAK